MSYILLVAAIIPIIALCAFIYTKDKNKEPKGLLALLFGLGFASVFPILICELLFGFIFPMSEAHGFISVFLHVMFGVALYEESFKWLITKFVGYNNKNFDEVFDVIVYSVFASLGFACFENIMYVFQNGLFNALTRALLSIPGHTCFAISMGYFFSKAKVGQINGNKDVYSKNIILSLVIPIILHTFYDAFLFNSTAQTIGELVVELFPFLVFYVVMVIVCFITVDKAAKVQQNLTTNLKNGTIMRNAEGYLYYNYPTIPVPVVSPVVTTQPQQVNTIVPESNLGVMPGVTPATSPINVPVMQPVVTQPVVETPVMEPVVEPPAIGGVFPDSPVSIPSVATNAPTTEMVVTYQELKACPICGKAVNGGKFCSRCGFRLK